MNGGGGEGNVMGGRTRNHAKNNGFKENEDLRMILEPSRDLLERL